MDKCCFEVENLVTTYKFPKDYFSKVFCIIILYLQPRCIIIVQYIFKFNVVKQICHYIKKKLYNPF